MAVRWLAGRKACMVNLLVLPGDKMKSAVPMYHDAPVIDPLTTSDGIHGLATHDSVYRVAQQKI